MKCFLGISRKRIVATGIAALVGVSGTGAWAAGSAVQDVDITVQAINEITVGSAVALTLVAAPGEGLSDTAESSYAITTNSSAGKKITAELTTALESGLTLSVNLEAPTGASSEGDVELSDTAADVVSSIEAVAEDNLTITYTATATVAVAPDTYPAEVTFTIVNDD